MRVQINLSLEFAYTRTSHWFFWRIRLFGCSHLFLLYFLWLLTAAFWLLMNLVPIENSWVISRRTAGMFSLKPIIRIKNRGMIKSRSKANSSIRLIPMNTFWADHNDGKSKIIFIIEKIKDKLLFYYILFIYNFYNWNQIFSQHSPKLDNEEDGEIKLVKLTFQYLLILLRIWFLYLWICFLASYWPHYYTYFESVRHIDYLYYSYKFLYFYNKLLLS